jgi:hypothetical protein
MSLFDNFDFCKYGISNESASYIILLSFVAIFVLESSNKICYNC